MVLNTSDFGDPTQGKYKRLEILDYSKRKTLLFLKEVESGHTLLVKQPEWPVE